MVEVERFELPISGSQNRRRRPNWATPRQQNKVIKIKCDSTNYVTRHKFYCKMGIEPIYFSWKENVISIRLFAK